MSIRTANGGDYVTGEDEGALFADASPSGDDAFSVVDRHSAFDGTFRADRDLRIEGEVKGAILCQGMLFVAQGAQVTAEVEAENITVAGDLNGEIRCRGRLQMMPSGRVRGKISTNTLVINEGAYYEGELEMAAPEDRAKQVPRSLSSGGVTPVQRARQPLQTPESRTGETAGGSTTFIRRLGSPETVWDTETSDDGESSTTPVADEAPDDAPSRDD